MDDKKIDKIMNEFLDKNEYNVILIDGPWGCGKTHQVNEFIKKRKKNGKKDKLFYISLFGLESIDEINTSIYYEVHKKGVFLRKTSSFILKGFSTVSKAVPVINPISDITNALDNQLGNLENKVKNGIIVLDDLERLSENIEYSNLLGYINKLLLSGCRVVCLASIENIKGKRKGDFNDFKEKVFDCVYTINKIDNEVFNKIFEKFKFDGMEAKFSLLNNNLRMAKKVSLFYEKIIDLFKKRNLSVKNNSIYSEIILFESTIYTVIIALKNNESKIFNEDYFIKDKNNFSENIALGMQKYFHNNSDFMKHQLMCLVEAMLYYFCYMDSSLLEEHLFPVPIDNQYSLLDSEFFYLSQIKKKEYKELLEKYILNTNFILKDNIKRIGNIVNYSNYMFSDEVFSKIAEAYLKEYSNDCSHILWDFHLDERERGLKGRVNHFKEKLIEKINKILQNKIGDFAIALQNEKDFVKLGKLIDDITMKKQNLNIVEINQIIVSNNFYLPDLSSDIDYEKWNYCHKIAKYALTFKLKEEFINYAKKLYSQFKDDETLKERLLALIVYNIDSNFSFDNYEI